MNFFREAVSAWGKSLGEKEPEGRCPISGGR